MQLFDVISFIQNILIKCPLYACCSKPAVPAASLSTRCIPHLECSFPRYLVILTLNSPLSHHWTKSLCLTMPFDSNSYTHTHTHTHSLSLSLFLSHVNSLKHCSCLTFHLVCTLPHVCFLLLESKVQVRCPVLRMVPDTHEAVSSLFS